MFRSEKSFAALMKSKKKPSLLKAMTMREDRALMYYTGKKLKGKKLKQFKKDMLFTRRIATVELNYKS